jgi:hypothetical protein
MLIKKRWKNLVPLLDGVAAVLLKWRAYGPPISAVNWEHQQRLIHAELLVSQICKKTLGQSLYPVLENDEQSILESLGAFAKDVPVVDRMTSVKIYEHPSRQTCAGSDMRFGHRDRFTSLAGTEQLGCHQCSATWPADEIKRHPHTRELLIPLHLVEQ